MKRTNLKIFICDAFRKIKQWVSKKISKIGAAGKIVAAIGLIGSVITIFGFITGKDLPELFHLTAPAATLEDSTTEDKSDKNNDTDNEKSNGVDIDVNINGPIDINGDENNGVNVEVNLDGADTNEANTESIEKLTMSQPAYREELERAIGSDMYIVAEYYNDYIT